MRRKGNAERAVPGSKEAEIFADRNKQRRAQYASDPGARDSIRDAARDRYHGGSARPQPLRNGLLTQGERREVATGEMEHPEVVESFTIPEAAAALGRSVATIRRWIETDRIPGPILEEVVRHNKVYSVGELETMQRVIAQHERDFVYLVSGQGNYIVETLHQAMHAYRAQFI